MKIINVGAIFIQILFFLVFSFNVANAFTDNTVDNAAGNTDKAIVLTNPLGDQNMKPQALIGNIINGVLGIVGSLALLMFIYGGFTWMTASGASEAVTKGKDIVVWATIGLIIIFSSYALVNFVITDVIKAP
jgi:hypothetical protein